MTQRGFIIPGLFFAFVACGGAGFVAMVLAWRGGLSSGDMLAVGAAAQVAAWILMHRQAVKDNELP